VSAAGPDAVTWASWSLDPAVGWCAAAGAAYAVGFHRAARPPAPVEAAAFAAGLAVTVVALASPLDALADELFAAHMSQHLLLALVAPLLIVVGAPGRALAALPSTGARRVLGRDLRRFRRATGLRRAAVGTALAAVAAHVLALGLWHVPALYDLAVRSVPVHVVEHVSLFVTGLALWWVVLGVRWQRRSGMAVVYLFLAGLPMGALAALLTLAPRPLYASHLATTAAWGLTPLEDQQLAGAIMWVPGGLVYLGAVAVVIVRWLGSGPAPGERRLGWDA
jgi:putative membrane protein